MSTKPTYEELEARIRSLENEHSEIKEIQGALRFRNAYLEYLFDTSPDAVVRADENHRINRVNPQFELMFGYSQEEAFGKRVDDLITREDKKGEALDLTHRVGLGMVTRVETVRYRKDGAPLFVDLMAAPIRTGDQLVGTYASYRDIKERKRSEKALQESEERFRQMAETIQESHKTLLTVLDSMDATVYVADMKSYEILFMNKYMRDDFGRDMVGQICWDVFRGYDGPCSHCTNDRLLDKEGRPAGVCVWEGQNPITGRWYINFDRAINWVDGRIVRLQVATDITRLKETELALRREREYLDALHETTLGLIGHLEATELLRTIIVHAAELVGVPDGYVYVYDERKDELVLQVAVGEFKDIVGLRLRPGEGLSGQVLQSGKPLLIEDYSSWAGRVTDRRLHGIKSIVGIPLKSGVKVTGILGLGSFDNARKFSHAEINILSRFAELASIALDNALLHSRVKEELSQRKLAEEERQRLERQLLHAQKMEAIGTLAAGIAHDFNNLLMGMQGNASLMLLDVSENHPHYPRIKSIEQCVKSCADLTKQLLGFARGGKYEVKPTNLNDLVKKTSDMFIRTRKEVTLDAQYEESIWTVEVDRGQIEQVLLNLYINAWQSMPGGGSLCLATGNVLADEKFSKPLNITPGKYAKISVTDTGIGMDESTQERVFDPFFTTKEMGRGTGLGLASAYGIIKNHGGVIDLQSQKGKGSTFTIYLPASREKAEKDLELPGVTLKGAGTILLVDDEETIVRVGREMLEKIGYEVLTANSGKEAIDLFLGHADQIDLVILDMIMPGMGGGDLYDRLREIRPSIKVLLSSGYSLHGHASDILAKGCQGFIQKPFNLSQLSKKLKEILDERPLHGV